MEQSSNTLHKLDPGASVWLKRTRGPIAPATASEELVVIGAGLPRSGTASLKQALETLLNKRCYHAIEVLANHHCAQWAAIYNDGWAARKDEMLQLLQPYGAAVDIPVMMLYKELMAAYPNAKVVLSVRDNFDAWYKSAYETIYQVYKAARCLPWYARWLESRKEPWRKDLHVFVSAFFESESMFAGKFEDKAAAKQIYDNWMASVKLHVPKDKLLLYNVKEGWDPLCKFLGLPVPQGQEFPYVNESAGFVAHVVQPRKRQVARLIWLPPLVVAAISAAAGAAVAIVRQHRRK